MYRIQHIDAQQNAQMPLVFPTRMGIGNAAGFRKLQLPDATSPARRRRPRAHCLRRICLCVLHIAMPTKFPTHHAAAFSKFQLLDAANPARRRRPGTHRLYRIRLFIFHLPRAGNAQMPVVIPTHEDVGHAAAFRNLQLPDATSPICGRRPGTYRLYWICILACNLAEEKLRIARTQAWRWRDCSSLELFWTESTAIHAGVFPSESDLTQKQQYQPPWHNLLCRPITAPLKTNAGVLISFVCWVAPSVISFLTTVGNVRNIDFSLWLRRADQHKKNTKA